MKKKKVLIIVSLLFLLTISCRPDRIEDPELDAGQNQVIRLPVSTVTLEGRARAASIVRGGKLFSSPRQDPIGHSLRWQSVSSPAGATLSIEVISNDFFLIIAKATGLTLPGEYVFQLILSDELGRVFKSNVNITVLPSIGNNQLPAANAGADQTIDIQTAAIQLTGSGTDPDGTIISYFWRQVSGPSSATIQSAASGSTTVTGLTTPGKYVFKLTVTDDQGATAEDEVSVIVTTASTFQVGTQVYSVNKTSTINTPGTNTAILAESFRSLNDSASMRFTFNRNLFAGESADFKVVKSFTGGNEVRLNVTTVKGTDGTLYESTDGGNVMAKVTISATGKVSVKMPTAELKQVLETKTITASADINEQ